MLNRQSLLKNCLYILCFSASLVSNGFAFASEATLYTLKNFQSGHVIITTDKARAPANYRVIKEQSMLRENYSSPVHSQIKAVNNKAFDQHIFKYAKEYQIDPYLIKAIIQIESSFNQRAVSPKGAQGLMQLMPATAERFGVNDSFSSNQNIKGGVKYLRWLMNKFNNQTHLVLAAYNAGENNVIKYKGIPPFEETINYVKKVVAVHRQLQKG